MDDTPILFLAPVFALLAVYLWNRHPLGARLGLGVATVFGLAALRWPGQSAKTIVEHTGDGLAWLVVCSQGVALAVVLLTVTGVLRELRAP